MITTVTDFDDETEWERTVLTFAMPLLPLSASETSAALDLRTNQVALNISDDICEQVVEEFRNTLLPLLFGAAWKLIDLALELAFGNVRIQPKNGKRWLIDEKIKEAEQGKGTIPGIAPSSDLWRALTALYAATSELRHALVHRRVQVEQNTRALIGSDRQGGKLAPISYDLQRAFCMAAQRFAQVVLTGAMTTREEADLRVHLKTLRPLHGITVAAAGHGGEPVKIIVDFPADRRVDVPSLLAKALATYPGRSYVDVEVHLSDGRVLVGELEHAPQTVVTIDPAALPAWLTFK